MKKVLSLLSLSMLIAISASAKSITTSYRNALIFAYSQANSVYEDDNIKLEIYDEQLWATNKTNKTIYIDYSQSFLINNGATFPLFSKKVDGKKNTSKAGATTSVDEFLTIAPATGGKTNVTFIVSLTAAGFYGQYTTSESPLGSFTDYDKRLLNLIGELVTESQKADPKGKEYIGTASRHLTEDESVKNYGAAIAYAFSKKAEEWTNVSISTWVSDVYFTPYYITLPSELTKKEKQGFGVKETSPGIVHVKCSSPFEFESDRSPIIVADWEGNFKKGTFKLANTRVAKQGAAGKILNNAFVKGLTKALTVGSELEGMEEIYQDLYTTYYKSVIQFEGESSDWGTMKFVDDKMKTGQK